jgi:hypothetical protein
MHFCRPSSILAMLLFGTGVIFLSGCGKDTAGPKLAPVSGRVTVDANPISIGSVTFHPDKAKGNASDLTPTASIQMDGTYKLTSGGKEGAPLGWYKVTVSPNGMPSTMPTDGKMPPAPNINQRYQKSETGMSIEVVENPPAGAYDLKLSR